MGKKTQKIVFKEADNEPAKAVFGTVEDLNNGFLRVTTANGCTFDINKNVIVFIKEGGY